MEQRGKFTIGDGKDISITQVTEVKLYETLTIYTEEGPMDIDIKISTNLDNIPDKYHEVFINLLTSKYYGKVTFDNNPFSHNVNTKFSFTSCLKSKFQKFVQWI